MSGCPFSLAAEAVRDPYPYYETVRGEGRAVFVPEIDAWVITAYDDIQTVLRQPGLASSRTPTGRNVGEVMAASIERSRSAGALPDLVERYLADPPDPTLFTIDPPDHTRQRRAVARMFAPAQVEIWEPAVRELAASTVVHLCAMHHVDLATDFAGAIALGTAMRLLGLEEHDRTRLHRWADDTVAVIGVPSPSDEAVVAMLTARAEMTRFFAGLIAVRRLEPTSDLTSLVASVATVDAPIEGVVLTESERIGLLINFHVAGTESTANLITNCAVALAGQPDLRDELDAHRKLVPTFVDEVLRLDPPSQGMYRALVRDLQLGDVTIPSGSQVYLVYAAGNRDPDQFAAPADLSPRRAGANRHLSFGQGAHLCLGAPLARMEARVAVEALLDGSVAIELTAAPSDFVPSYLLHGARSVRATVVRR